MTEDYTDLQICSHWGMFDPNSQFQYAPTVLPEIREGNYWPDEINWKDRYEILKKKSKIAEDSLKLKISKLEQKCAELHKKLKEETPLWKQVFNQTDFYNGHGQMTLGRLTLSEIKKLLQDLQENVPKQFDPMNDIFYLSLCVESDGTFSGSVNQSLDDGDDRLWLSIYSVVIDEGSVDESKPIVTKDEDDSENY